MNTLDKENNPVTSAVPGAFYRAVWRWHFLAGLFVAPFVIFLAITGAAYLWKPQFEAWKYRDLFNTSAPASATELSADAQLAAIRAAYPNFNPLQFIPAPRAGRSSEVQLASLHGSERVSVFVDPARGKILGQIDEASRPMRVLHDLHGTLLAGTVGQLIIEMAASWTFVLILSGFYLWWPRPFTIRGFLLPRFAAGRRALLRDLHAVPAVWLCVLSLFQIATGIQWTPVAGKWSRTLAQAVGEWQPRETSASAHRSEILGGWSPYLNSKYKANQAAKVASIEPVDEHAEHHAGMHHQSSSGFLDDPTHPRITLEHVRAIAAERKVDDAYAIVLPQTPTGVFSVITDRDHAFSRAYLHLDQYSGKVLADIRYGDFGRIAKFYTFGIIAHEGHLFGLANQILGLILCLGLILLVVTGLMMWWSRRPAGKLAAPASSANSRLPRVVVIGTLILAALLPLLAAALGVLMIFDWVFGRRLEGKNRSEAV